MHSCPNCGMACYCSGDIDDCEVMADEWVWENCTCPCEEMSFEDEDHDDDEDAMEEYQAAFEQDCERGKAILRQHGHNFETFKKTVLDGLGLRSSEDELVFDFQTYLAELSRASKFEEPLAWAQEFYQERINENKMRYFRIGQFMEPKSMFHGDRKVDIAELEKVANEITEKEADQLPGWGSGNMAVEEDGSWTWKATNFDSSD